MTAVQAFLPGESAEEVDSVLQSKSLREGAVPQHTDEAAGNHLPEVASSPRPFPSWAIWCSGRPLDNIAHRYYKDPESFWRICDANLEPCRRRAGGRGGRIILIPHQRNGQCSRFLRLEIDGEPAGEELLPPSSRSRWKTTPIWRTMMRQAAGRKRPESGSAWTILDQNSFAGSQTSSWK
jgi:hypothetical protein